jgi:peptidoglycan-associated lipoprotein
MIKGFATGAALLALTGCSWFGETKGGTESTTQIQTDEGQPVRVGVLKPDGILTPADNLAAAGINDTIYFDYDKTTLRPEALPTLQSVADWIRSHPTVQIRVAGHADERGTREYNLALGDRRATTVRNYLVSLGIPATRLDTVSYGKERPAIVGSTEESWAKNRRAIAEIE